MFGRRANTWGQAALTRGLAALLWGAVGLALVLGLVNCARFAPAPEHEPTDPAPRAVAGPPTGCAEQVVAAWLAGEATRLGVTAGDDEPAHHVERTFTVSATAVESPTRWVYVVGAQLRDGADRDAEVPHFAVTMIQTGAGCQGWSPAALPMRVAAPSLTVAAPAHYPVALPASDTALSNTLHVFFNGLLAGGDGLDRYLAPQAQITALVPPPYSEVRVTEVRAATEVPSDAPADGTTVALLVTVAVPEAALPLTYPVTLAARAGRWEVFAIDA